VKPGVLLLVAAIVAVASGDEARAGSTTILARGVVASGGNTGTRLGEVLRGTVGQACAARSLTAAQRLCSGFWCLGAQAVLAADDGGKGRLPTAFALGPPVPNPARGAMRMTLALPSDAVIAFEVFDAQGRSVGIPVTGRFPAGQHTLTWEPHGLAPGVFFGRLQVNGAERARVRLLHVN